MLKQDAPYVISEVAILFENDSYKNYDSIILVIATEEFERIKRVLISDNDFQKQDTSNNE